MPIEAAEEHWMQLARRFKIDALVQHVIEFVGVFQCHM
jgi:hypothetical protein